jgi:hypothetical protein
VIGRKRKKKKRKGDEDMNEVGFVSTHHWNNEPSLSEKARHGAVPHCMYVSIYLPDLLHNCPSFSLIFTSIPYLFNHQFPVFFIRDICID